MLSCQLVMNALERIAPRRLAEDWDNPGLLVGSYAQKVNRILVALDVDDAVDGTLLDGDDLALELVTCTEFHMIFPPLFFYDNALIIAKKTPHSL